MYKIMVNTAVPMSQKMMDALAVLETHCFFTNKETITTQEVKDWLAKNNYKELVTDYQSDFIWLVP
tara:strand:- start:1322 stop:1519 length:198 start_codon:yes stop_codon:yes gene_type:complete